MNSVPTGNVCERCGESKDASTARFVHVRLGLDEPPEPILCKCKDPMIVLDSIRSKTASAISCISVDPNVTIEVLPDPVIDSVLLDVVNTKAVREVELRLDAHLARIMFEKMSAGMYENCTTAKIREVGCAWWTGPVTNVNAKVRKRSNGESVVKISKSRTKVAPGYILGISDEHTFNGRIKNVQYDVIMTEIRATIKVAGADVNVIARRYENDHRESYAAEFEMLGRVTNTIVRSVMCLSLGTVGAISTMRDQIDYEFMSNVRSSDHVVVDVPDMDGYKASFMTKVDGVKVYVFCYEFGYIVCITDPDLTVVSCMVTITSRDLPEYSKTPDVVLAEMLTDGTLVYINALAMNGNARLPESMHSSTFRTSVEKPQFIYREVMDTIPTKLQLELEPMPSDGVVAVTRFRTLRLKEPTVDLLYLDGKLNAIESGVLVEVVDGDPNMEDNTIYEMDVVREKDAEVTRLVRPMQRLLKKVPNSMDVVRRAVAKAAEDPTITAMVLDMTSMSFAMRERVYTSAQAKASPNRKVIVSFGAGRFQEWRQMFVENFSYIAVDPDINVEDLALRTKRISIAPYDFKASFNSQVISISKSNGTVLWAKCRSEDFIRMTMPTRIMSSIGIPAVFSFSISYHIETINMLKSEGVPVFGCGYVHDAMPGSGVGRVPVTMKPTVMNRTTIKSITATFGKSTYEEPFLSMSAVPGLVLVRNVMPELWKSVDSSTVAIMERAVIMSA